MFMKVDLPEPEGPNAAPLGWLRPAGETDDGVLSVFDVASENLGRGAVGEAERERHRLDLAARVQHPHTPGDSAPPVVVGGLIVPGALLSGQDFPDPGSRRLPD